MFESYFRREGMESQLNVLAELRNALYASREALLHCSYAMQVEELDADLQSELRETVDNLQGLEQLALDLTNKVVALGLSND